MIVRTALVCRYAVDRFRCNMQNTYVFMQESNFCYVWFCTICDALTMHISHNFCRHKGSRYPFGLFIQRAMESPSGRTPVLLSVALTGTPAYYEKVRAQWSQGSIGCRACWLWMHPNSYESHVNGLKHKKRIVACGLQTEDVLEIKGVTTDVASQDTSGDTISD